MVYLPEHVKAAVENEARGRGVPRHRVIRDAMARAVVRPRPRHGIIDGPVCRPGHRGGRFTALQGLCARVTKRAATSRGQLWNWLLGVSTRNARTALEPLVVVLSARSEDFDEVSVVSFSIASIALRGTTSRRPSRSAGMSPRETSS